MFRKTMYEGLEQKMRELEELPDELMFQVKVLIERDKKYQELADSLPQVIFETDINGNLTYANRSAFSLFGYTQDDFDKGLNVLQMIIHDDRQRAISNIERVMKGETLGGTEYTARKKDGSTFPVAIYSTSIISENKPVGLRGIVVDLTKIKQTEKALHESEEKYRNLVERANDGIAILQDGILKYVNPSLAKLTGYNIEELIGSHFIDFVVPEEVSKLVDRYTKRMEGHDVIPIYETAFKNKNGQRIDIETNAGIITYDGKPADLVIIRDITERKRLLAQLRQSQKMEAIGTLASGIAHDFNNILSPIMILSEMSMMDFPSDSSVKQNLRNIYKSCERAKTLVKQILTFARGGEENRIPLKASLIVEEAINFMRAAIPSNINIQLDIKAKYDTVLADPTQMNQIVMNLCTNASHAMRETGGVLLVSLIDEYIDLDRINTFLGLKPGHYLRLSVSDTGSGISPDIIDKVFEPYFTTKVPDEGTGMGLAVVHGIVKKYGGNITFKSEIGKGTIFHVLLPIVDSVEPVTIDQKAEFPRGEERILLVDDEKAAVDALQSILEKLGYKVTTRTSSIEALEAFRHKNDEFDLVITDHTMPNMTGKELANELIAIRPDIPIILYTGFSEQINEKKAKEAGIKAFVLKPILMHEMAKTIRQVLSNKF